MRKPFALLGASVLGASGAVALSASPAQALPVDECATVQEHVPSTEPLADADWYMECVPQFGAGKVDFTLDVSDVPDDGDDEPFLRSPSTVITAGALDGVNETYFGSPVEIPEGFTIVGNNGGPEDYTTSMIFAIDGVGAATTTDLPAVCAGGVYDRVYRVTYLPTTITASQQSDGVRYETSFTVTPQPLFLGLSFLDNGEFDPAGSQCASSGDNTLFALDSTTDGEEWGEIVGTVATGTSFESLTPFPLLVGAVDVGTFPVVEVVAPTPTPTPSAAPELAATGIEVAPIVGTGVSLLGLGLLALVGRRRKAANS